MRVLFTLLGTLLCFTIQAQKQEALQLMQKMTDTYQQAAGLSFEVQFRYASETAPNAWLDSLTGRFIINGTQYWSDIDNTETISTGEYTITLFRDDQLMYLTKAPNADHPMAALTGSALLQNDSTIQWRLED